MAMVGKVPGDQVLGVVDDADGRERVEAQMRANEQRLGVGVADAADAAAAGQLAEIVFKFGAEGRVADGMDLPVAAALRVPDGHAAVAGARG